jgi:hypothetical protein
VLTSAIPASCGMNEIFPKNIIPVILEDLRVREPMSPYLLLNRGKCNG